MHGTCASNRTSPDSQQYIRRCALRYKLFLVNVVLKEDTSTTVLFCDFLEI